VLEIETFKSDINFFPLSLLGLSQKIKKPPNRIYFGSQAVCYTDPLALRPYLTASLPFRVYYDNKVSLLWMKIVPSMVGDLIR